MSYFKLTRKEFADKLRENRSIIDYVNQEDKHFWKHTFLVYLNTGCYVDAVFLVHHDNLQDAYDEIADYSERKNYVGYFAEEEYLEELRADAIKDGHDEDCYVEEQFTSAGNYGKYFCNIGLVYELQK